MAPSDPSSLSSKYTLSPAERRASLRFRSNLRVNCQPVAQAVDSSEPAYAAGSGIRKLQAPDDWCSRGKDISTNGVGLICSRPLDPGTVLDCQFLNPTTRFTCSCPVRVMRITPQADDKWLAGCRFAQELEFSQLLGLL
jgi:hypothetical protein